MKSILFIIILISILDKILDILKKVSNYRNFLSSLIILNIINKYI